MKKKTLAATILSIIIVSVVILAAGIRSALQPESKDYMQFSNTVTVTDSGVEHEIAPIHFEPIGFELLPETFTMPQLQNLYESILGVRFDRRNFSSKMLHLGLLETVGERPSGTSSRIPVTYRFNKENYDLLKSKGFRLEF